MIETLKQPIPVLPIRNAVLFPGTAIPLKVGRVKSSRALEAASRGEGHVLVVTQREDHEKEAQPADLYSVGTLAKIERMRGSFDEGYNVLVRGVERVRLTDVRDTGAGAGTNDQYIAASAEGAPELPHADPSTLQALLESMKKLGREILNLLPADTSHLEQLIDGIQDLSFLTHLVAANLDLEIPQKQSLLENQGVKERALELLDLMQKFKEGLEVQSEIREKLSRKMGKLQREGLLREQLKAIREELGEEGEEKKADDLREKIDKAGMPEDVKKTALEELKRLESQAGGASAEAHVIRNYLELLVALPWSKSSALAGAEHIDLERARQVLDADHYGLQKIKARIIQHLAVMKLRKGTRGSILVLVGPPGVGKTSLGQSVARALGRKFVRVSLGGVRDDAEIRGHRRTYVGAMPGRVIQGMKRAGENDPVMLLDEIDKLARSFQGDPASALLEVLDPEQNQNFLDHYLDVTYDLSKVFFICTANSLETIPGPLLDRMEVIEVSGYTTAEKFHIARNHLISKQEKEHGLDAGQVLISDEALMRIITHYTREAGVRELQRKIAEALRGSTEKVLAKNAVLPVRIEAKNLEDVLGPERYVLEAVERIAPPGVVTGLAWTPVGGDILLIEANSMPGAGRLTLTGQLGDVMKESAQIAVSLVRSRLAHLIPGFEHDKRDLHIHVPAGAIPKDGPSAGVTMTTTIASLLLNRSVSPKLAMTGEVTLRGAVLPVGGIKEKVIAAHRAGIEKVILPKRNQKDLREVPEEVRSQMKFEFVENVTEVLRIALGIEASSDQPGLATGASAGAPPSQSPAIAKQG